MACERPCFARRKAVFQRAVCRLLRFGLSPLLFFMMICNPPGGVVPPPRVANPALWPPWVALPTATAGQGVELYLLVVSLAGDVVAETEVVDGLPFSVYSQLDDLLLAQVDRVVIFLVAVGAVTTFGVVVNALCSEAVQ